MILQEMFAKEIDRDLKGVIKVGQGDEENIRQELEEYVVTRELQKHFAEFYVQLEGVRLLANKAVEILQKAWDIGENLTAEQRGEVSIAIATAKIAATNTSLFVTQNIFQVMGARATTAKLNLDRFWRNVRTQTLHDPIDYKYQEVGEWVLTGKVPDPSFYA